MEVKEEVEVEMEVKEDVEIEKEVKEEVSAEIGLDIELKKDHEKKIRCLLELRWRQSRFQRYTKMIREEDEQSESKTIRTRQRERGT